MTNYLAREMNGLGHNIAANNIAHGFKDEGEKRDPIYVTMLITSEPVEAFEELRSGHHVTEVYYECPGGTMICNPHRMLDVDRNLTFTDENGMAYCNTHNLPVKPEGWPIEMADTIIRILDASSEYGLDMARLVQIKMAYNETRPYKHGRTM